MNAYDELINFLLEEEEVIGVVFGDWGWGIDKEPANPIPVYKKGVLLSLHEAKPLMQGWSFNTGYGAPDCYAAFIWTDRRLIWVVEYDGGVTRLHGAPRNPTSVYPYIQGG